MLIVLFNGPPGSGKDTIAQAYRNSAISATQDVRIVKFADPVRKAAIGTFDHLITAENLDQLKNKFIPGSKVTLRQWMIKFCEEFMKPMFGKDIFADLMMQSIKQYPKESVVLVTDCGFIEEVNYCCDHLPPDAKIILIHVFRKDTDFKDDSRSYLNTVRPADVLMMENNGTVDQAAANLAEVIEYHS
jgi:hypothetical protein